GVVISTPMASPASQMVHVIQYPTGGNASATSMDVVPSVALSDTATMPPSTMRATASRMRSNCGRNPTSLSKRQATTEEAVLPSAFRTTTSAGPPNAIVVSSAPANTPGVARHPHWTRQNSATPVDGHSGLI